MDIKDPFDTPLDTSVTAPVEVAGAPAAAPSHPAAVGINDPFDVGGGSPQQEPELSRLGHVAAMVTDIPHKTAEAFTSGVSEANRNLNPFSKEYREDYDAYQKDLAQRPWYDVRPTLKRNLEAGPVKGLLGLGAAAVSPITGASRSVIGHGMRAIAPRYTEEEMAKLKAKGYDAHNMTEAEADAAADLAMMALGPGKGKPVPAKAAPSPPPPPPKPSGPLGVTLSKGQETGELPLIQREQAALQGSSGKPAQERAGLFAAQQESEVAAAKGQVLDSMAPPGRTVPTITNPHEAAEVIADTLINARQGREAALQGTTTRLQQAQQRLRQELSPTGNILAETPQEAAGIISRGVEVANDNARAASQAAYTQFNELPGEFYPAAFNRVSQDIRARVAAPEDPAQITLINPQNTPNANSALSELQEILGGVAQRRNPDTGQILPRSPVTPRLVENARQRLNAYLGDAISSARSDPKYWKDVRAVERVIDAFDAQVTSKLRTAFTGGDPKAVATAIERARQLHSAWRRTFTSKGAGDKVGTAMQNIIGRYDGQALTPEQLATTLYGQNGKAVGEHLGRVFGADSPEMGAARQGLFSHITEAPPGKSPYTPKQVADRIDQFTQGPGRSLTETYLKPPEIQRLQAYGNQLRAHGADLDRAADPIDQVFSRIAGAEGVPPASTQDVVSQLFSGALKNNRYSVELVQRLKSQLGEGSREWGTYRQGLLRHALEKGIEGRDVNHQKAVDNLRGLARSQIGREVYTVPQRQMIEAYADLRQKLIVPPLGRNWSNTSAFNRPNIVNASQWVVGAIGDLVAHTMGVPWGVSEAIGLGTAKASKGIIDAAAARAVAKQMPLVAEQVKKYQKALNAYNKTQNGLTRASLVAGTAALSNSLAKMGIDFSKFPALQLPGAAPAEESQEKRAAGGSVVSEDIPQYSDLANSLNSSVTNFFSGPKNPERPSYVMEPDLQEAQMGMNLPPSIVQYDDGGKLFYRDTNEPVPIARRSNVLPVAMTPEGLKFSMPKVLDIFGNVMGGVAGAPAKAGETLLGSGAVRKVAEAAKGVEAADAGPFYSTLDRAITNAPQDKMQGQQWLGWLKNQPGVKQEELDWLGVAELVGHNKPVTKQELLQHTQGRGVELQEVEKRFNQLPTKEYLDEAAGEHYGRQYDELDAGRQRDLVEELRNSSPQEGQTKFHQYQLPGGENYRELMLSLPHKHDYNTLVREYAQRKGINSVHEAYERFDSSDEPLVQRARQIQKEQYPQDTAYTAYDGLSSAGKRFYLDKAAGEKPYYSVPVAHAYGDSKADKNRILHMRINDRQIPDVGKSLHLEELQSDWHQAGRRYGYARQFNEAKLGDIGAGKVVAHAEGSPPKWEFVDNRTGEPIYAWAHTEEQARGQAVDTLNVPRNRSLAAAGVPNAPFKQTWPELGLKRAITKAAKEGYDAISWTPGEQQAARYDLSSHLENLSVARHSGDKYSMVGDIKGGTRQHNFGTDIPEDELANHVGKEMAEKIRTGPTQQDYDNPGLKVGGEGMKAFYDKMLVDKANALGKKFGAKVEWKDLKALDGSGDWHRMDDIDLETFAGAEDGSLIKRSLKVPVLRLTPQLKEHALKGLPLFNRGGAVASNYEQDSVPGPPADQNDGDEIEKQRAAGGRVLLSNIDADPSQAQQQAGNYAKEHIHVVGLPITIENAKGSIRSGVGKDGKPWSARLPCNYGYFKKSAAADGDHVDVYLGPHRASPHAFVIDQVDPDTGKYDEAKVGLFFGSQQQFISCYKAAFSDGKATARIGGVKELPLGEFKHWLKNGDTTKPIAEHDFRKMSHEKAEYRFPATSESRRCRNCEMYVRPVNEASSCTAVLSPIQPGAVCKLFEKR